MKRWFSALCCFAILPTSSRAQGLSGTWQGVEFHLPRVGFWPAVLTITEGSDGSISGLLEQESGDNPARTVRFQINGKHSGDYIRLDQTSILYENSPSSYSWCQGYLICTYDAQEERLSARATFRPIYNCTESTLDLFRIKLKSPASVLANTQQVLRVSGRQVAWFSDPTLQHLVAEGNIFRTRLTKTTTFYLTQGFYPSRKSGPVAITVRVLPVAHQRTTPLPPLRLQKPLSLPAVLFQTGTAELLPTATPTLAQLAEQLRAQPNARFRIAGHTDRIGDAAKNLVLSEQRAAAVRRFLVEMGIAENRLEIIGYGHSRLLYPSPDLRNRRVEIQALQ